MTLVLEPSRHDSQPSAGLLRRLSVAYRRSVGGISQHLYNPVTGAPARMETLLSHLCRFGAKELARKIVARFIATVEGTEAQPLDASLKITAQQADADEEVAEIAYELDPSDANLERLARATEKQAYTSTEKALSLRAEQRRRRGNA